MDKDVLAVIGKLYLDTFTLNNYAENLKARIAELETQLASLNSQNKKDNK
jgi:hypothetical protein